MVRRKLTRRRLEIEDEEVAATKDLDGKKKRVGLAEIL
jgi:hypothetical protein